MPKVNTVPPAPAGVPRACAAPLGDAFRRSTAATDAAGLDRLYRQEKARLTGFFKRQTGDHEAAAELVQEAFARLCAAERTRPIRSAEAYLRSIVRNLLNDRWRRREPVHVALHHTDEPAVAADQHLALEAAQAAIRIEQALTTLAPRSRDVFLLHRDRGLRYADIAVMLGITTSTVEYHMTRALQHLACELLDLE